MEIREPRYKVGDKMNFTNHPGIFEVVEMINFNFCINDYFYKVKHMDFGEIFITNEANLEPYVEKPKTVCDLEDGEVYYYISNDYAGVMSTNWTNSMCDCGRRAVGNAFMDSDDAFHDLQRQKIEAEMLKLGGRRTFNYYESENWNIKADASGGLIIQSGYCLQTASVIYFKSKEDAEIAISEIGEDRIKKYIFGVK